MSWKTVLFSRSKLAAPPVCLAFFLTLLPMSILSPTQGLNITVVSYCGEMHFGLTVDPELVPEPGVLSDGIAHLAAIPKLKSLKLKNSQVSDAAVTHLMEMPELLDVDIQNTMPGWKWMLCLSSQGLAFHMA